jgi:hypothetical protein
MLTTAALMKSQLGITGSGYDTILGTIATAVDKWFEGKTGVKVGDTAVVTITDEIVDSLGGLTIKLKFKPIVSLTSIYYLESDGTTWTEYTDEAVGDIDFDDEGDEIYTLYVVRAKGKRKLKITYTCGYISSGGSANVPADIKQAATNVGCALFNRRGNEGIKSTSIEGLSQTFEDITKADPLVRQVLTQYQSVYAL